LQLYKIKLVHVQLAFITPIAEAVNVRNDTPAIDFKRAKTISIVMITDVGMTRQLNFTYGVHLGIGIGTMTVFEISLLRGRVDRNPNNTYTF